MNSGATNIGNPYTKSGTRFTYFGSLYTKTGTSQKSRYCYLAISAYGVPSTATAAVLYSPSSLPVSGPGRRMKDELSFNCQVEREYCTSHPRQAWRGRAGQFQPRESPGGPGPGPASGTPVSARREATRSLYQITVTPPTIVDPTSFRTKILLFTFLIIIVRSILMKFNLISSNVPET